MMIAALLKLFVLFSAIFVISYAVGVVMPIMPGKPTFLLFVGDRDCCKPVTVMIEKHQNLTLVDDFFDEGAQDRLGRVHRQRISAAYMTSIREHKSERVLTALHRADVVVFCVCHPARQHSARQDTATECPQVEYDWAQRNAPTSQSPKLVLLPITWRTMCDAAMRFSWGNVLSLRVTPQMPYDDCVAMLKGLTASQEAVNARQDGNGWDDECVKWMDRRAFGGSVAEWWRRNDALRLRSGENESGKMEVVEEEERLSDEIDVVVVIPCVSDPSGVIVVVSALFAFAEESEKLQVRLLMTNVVEMSNDELIGHSPVDGSREVVTQRRMIELRKTRDKRLRMKRLGLTPKPPPPQMFDALDGGLVDASLANLNKGKLDWLAKKEENETRELLAKRKGVPKADVDDDEAALEFDKNDPATWNDPRFACDFLQEKFGEEKVMCVELPQDVIDKMQEFKRPVVEEGVTISSAGAWQHSTAMNWMIRRMIEDVRSTPALSSAIVAALDQDILLMRPFSFRAFMADKCLGGVRKWPDGNHDALRYRGSEEHRTFPYFMWLGLMMIQPKQCPDLVLDEFNILPRRFMGRFGSKSETFLDSGGSTLNVLRKMGKDWSESQRWAHMTGLPTCFESPVAKNIRSVVNIVRRPQIVNIPLKWARSADHLSAANSLENIRSVGNGWNTSVNVFYHLRHFPSRVLVAPEYTRINRPLALLMTSEFENFGIGPFVDAAVSAISGIAASQRGFEFLLKFNKFPGVFAVERTGPNPHCMQRCSGDDAAVALHGLKPNFMIVGAENSHQRWLSNLVDFHGAIMISKTRFLSMPAPFANLDYEDVFGCVDMQAFQSPLEAWGGMEETLHSAEARLLMAKTLPDAKIVVLLRDPFLRLAQMLGLKAARTCDPGPQRHHDPAMRFGWPMTPNTSRTEYGRFLRSIIWPELKRMRAADTRASKVQLTRDEIQKGCYVDGIEDLLRLYGQKKLVNVNTKKSSDSITVLISDEYIDSEPFAVLDHLTGFLGVSEVRRSARQDLQRVHAAEQSKDLIVHIKQLLHHIMRLLEPGMREWLIDYYSECNERLFRLLNRPIGPWITIQKQMEGIKNQNQNPISNERGKHAFGSELLFSNKNANAGDLESVEDDSILRIVVSPLETTAKSAHMVAVDMVRVSTSAKGSADVMISPENIDKTILNLLESKWLVRLLNKTRGEVDYLIDGNARNNVGEERVSVFGPGFLRTRHAIRSALAQLGGSFPRNADTCKIHPSVHVSDSALVIFLLPFLREIFPHLLIVHVTDDSVSESECAEGHLMDVLGSGGSTSMHMNEEDLLAKILLNEAIVRMYGQTSDEWPALDEISKSETLRAALQRRADCLLSRLGSKKRASGVKRCDLYGCAVYVKHVVSESRSSRLSKLEKCTVAAFEAGSRQRNILPSDVDAKENNVSIQECLANH